MKARVLADRLPRLEYGDRFLSDFLPERVLSESRLGPPRPPGGAPAAPGAARDRSAILIAAATHRDPKPHEWEFMLGERLWPAWKDRVFFHHDREDLENLGTMPDGTPVELNGRAARPQAIVSLSDLDYHYFAGVSGGAKQIG